MVRREALTAVGGRGTADDGGRRGRRGRRRGANGRGRGSRYAGELGDDFIV